MIKKKSDRYIERKTCLQALVRLRKKKQKEREREKREKDKKREREKENERVGEITFFLNLAKLLY